MFKILLLEKRILLDASAATVVADALSIVHAPGPDSTVHAQVASDAAPVSVTPVAGPILAHTDAPSAPEVHILVVASNVQDSATLASAANNATKVIYYDADHTTLSQLSEKIESAAAGQQVDSIAFAHGGKAGLFKLASDATVSADTLAHNNALQAFWIEVGSITKDGGAIDLLACNVAATIDGQNIVTTIETLADSSGHNVSVAASTDLTGSASQGGNWILEMGNRDAAAIYFNDSLTQWNQVLALPVARNDTFTITESSGLGETSFLGNDTLNGATTITIVTNPTHASGFMYDPTTQLFNYTSTPNFNGTDSFTYRLTNSEGSDNATVTINITSVNDAPYNKPVEVVTVPFSDTDGVNTTQSYSGVVEIRIEGMGWALSEYLSDAFYYLDSSGTPVYADGGGYWHFQINNQNPTVMAYQSDHAYEFTYNLGTTSAPVNFKLADQNYTDNGGSYRVTIATPTVLNITTSEDTTATLASVLTSTGATDTNAASESNTPLTVAVVTSPLHDAAFSLSAAGALSYTPDANYVGSDSFTYHIRDSLGLFAPTNITVNITVTSVNDAPSYTPGTNLSILEDAGAQSVAWATNISAGPANESGQSVAFVVSNDNNALFTVQPSIAANGTLTYQTAPNANGSANVSVVLQDNGGTANGGVDSSGTQTFTINVTPVNDAPTFTTGPDQVVADHAGPQTVHSWATNITTGAANEVQSLSFTTSNDHSAFFSSQPVLNTNGDLSYTPAPGASGTAVVTAVLTDSGGTSNGGIDAVTHTFTITITNTENYHPGTDQTILEDAGSQSVTWATNVNPDGNSNPTFTVTNDNNGLFAVQPSIAPDGTLTYTAADNAYGSAQVNVVYQDSAEASDPYVFTINITPVNDAPSYTPGTDHTILEDAGMQSLVWATNISSGPANESSQTLAFNVTNDNNALFAVQPSIAADGTLTYQAADNANGSATVTVVLKDDGGIANGGVDATAPFTFTINVTAVNDAPSYTPGADQTVLEDSGFHFFTYGTNVSTGPANEVQAIAVTVSNDNPALFASQPSGIIGPDTILIGYTPAANAFGTANVTVVLTDNGGTANGGVNSTSHTFAINVTPVNDAPSYTPGSDQTILEDAGAQSLVWATNVSAGPANESGQSVTFIVNNDNNALFAVQPTIAADGTLTYQAAGDANGSATVTVVLQDDGGTNNGGVDATAPYTFMINVTAVNDAPSYTPGTDQTILEDAGAQSLVWATNMSVGPANESSQTHNFIVNNDNNSLFVVQPTIAPDGTLTYQTADDANGSATVTVVLQDNGGTDNGGVNATVPYTFMINVTAVNDAPSYTPGANQTILEDAGAQSLIWATNISQGPANESSQTLTFLVNNDNNALFAVQPTIAADGTLTYQAADDANGSATVTVVLQDNGGTNNGGVDATAPYTFMINVTAVNDTPSYTPGTDQTILEDAGAQSLVWATNISVGPANESSQTHNFIVNNDNNALFAVQPTIAPDGTLTYQTAGDANGSATVTVVLQDDGGTNNGGVDATAPHTFTINVTAVNDAPSYTPGTDQTLLEDAGAQSLTWATNISSGPANESSQTLSFVVTNDNNALFAVQPSIAPDGTLTYQTADDANGSAIVTVVLQDSGGTSNGGVDATAPLTFTINATPVNDTPTYTPGNDQTILEDAGNQSLAWATNISQGPANESSQTLSFLVSNNNNALFAIQPSIAPDGILTYRPADDANGSAIVTVTLQDSGGTANGGVDATAPLTFTINVTPVNDIPTYTPGTDQTVLEDAGSQSLTWATNLSQGPGNESSQTLSFLVSNSNPSLFAVQPSIAPDGTLTYRPADDANGSAVVSVVLKDTGGTSNGGVDATAPHTFTINVTPVNDTPSYTPGTDQTVLEDAGSQSLVWATNISKGPANESTQTLTFTVTNDNNALFAVQPSIAANGALTYKTVDNANGSAIVTVVLQDSGGTANGGVDATAPQTFAINVTPVNDAPTFTPGADQVILEDAAAQSIAWATNITTGPTNESAQTVHFDVENNAHNLFSVQPFIDTSGQLQYTAAPDANGIANLKITLQDDGGTANGGIDNVVANMKITIVSVNDAPVVKDSQFTSEGPGIINITSNNTADFHNGAPSENNQPLAVLLVHPPQSAAAFVLNPDGTFGYIPQPGFNGVDTFTFQILDSSGGLSKVGTVTIVVQNNPAPTQAVAPPAVSAPATSAPTASTVSSSSSGSGSGGSLPPPVFALSLHPDSNVVASEAIQSPPISETKFIGNKMEHTIVESMQTHALSEFTPSHAGSFEFQNLNIQETEHIPSITPIETSDTHNLTYSTGLIMSLSLPTTTFVSLATLQAGSGLTMMNINSIFQTPDLGDLISELIRRGPVLVVAELVDTPTHAKKFTLNHDGTFTYVPKEGFSGEDKFSYLTMDNAGNILGIASISVSLSTIQQIPQSVDDSYVIMKNNAFQGSSVLLNDIPLKNSKSQLSAKLVQMPSQAAKFVLNRDGTFLYVPNPDFVGQDFFQYQAVDEEGNASNIATAFIEVDEGKIKPQIINAPIFSQAFHIDEDGAFIYTPNLQFVGKDSFTVENVNSKGQPTQKAEVQVQVTALKNQYQESKSAPSVALGSSIVSASEEQINYDQKVINHAETLVAQVLSGPLHGTLLDRGNGAFIYYGSNVGFNGIETIDYKLYDSTPLATAKNIDRLYVQNSVSPTLLGLQNDLGDLNNISPARASLVVAISNYVADDRLSIIPSGNITLQNGSLYMDGREVGHWEGGFNGHFLKITFNEYATAETLAKVATQIGYFSISTLPGTDNRNVHALLTSGKDERKADMTVFFYASLDKPVLSLEATQIVIYDGIPTEIGKGISVQDPLISNDAYLQVEVRADHGILALTEYSGLSKVIFQNGGHGPSINFKGTLKDVNEVISRLLYQRNGATSAEDTLHITISHNNTTQFDHAATQASSTIDLKFAA